MIEVEIKKLASTTINSMLEQEGNIYKAIREPEHRMNIYKTITLGQNNKRINRYQGLNSSPAK